MVSVAVASGFTAYSEGEPVCMDVDSNNPDPKYWEGVLRHCGLSMSRGKHLKTKTKHGTEDRNLIPVGGSAELDAVEARQTQKSLGRVTASGHGPDD
jgi:hypothetical protein